MLNDTFTEAMLEGPEEFPMKRKRGRPRKVRTPEELAKLNAPKRPRGRPRKNPIADTETV